MQASERSASSSAMSADFPPSSRYTFFSVAAGERLGARPELGRTYREIGQRLSENGSKYRELSGVTAAGYLEKARRLFTALQLEWDLGQLDAARFAA